MEAPFAKDLSHRIESVQAFRAATSYHIRHAAAVVDPPRAGAARQIKELAASNVGRVAYVSCNPTTFARDARTLVAGEYHLQSVTPVDQFVWSSHIELVGIFSRP